MDENDLPNEMSDMYSFCCLFWELFNGECRSLAKRVLPTD